MNNMENEKTLAEQMEGQNIVPQETEIKKEIVPEVTDEMGVVAENTRIVGNVVTKGHLAIAGTVDGDITAKGNIIVTGNVNGKITCNNLILDGCQLSTMIEASGQVALKENVTVTGDISCKDISVSGTMKGNITALGQAGFTETAVVTGNVKADKIGMAIGAKVNGNISMA